MDKLPKPQHEYGYTPKQIKSILKKLKISESDFNETFSVNTCAMGKNGETIIYPQDLEQTLYNLQHKLGKFHLWD